MTFDPTLPTATDRVRLFIGDTAATPQMPGGETTYAALAARYTSDEPAYAKAAAQMLRAALAGQPTSVSGGGEGVSWSNRLAHLNDIVSGKAPYPFAGGVAASGLRGLWAGGTSAEPMFRRTSLGTDPVLEEVPDGA